MAQEASAREHHNEEEEASEGVDAAAAESLPKEIPDTLSEESSER